jgi:hypothetical protein
MSIPTVTLTRDVVERAYKQLVHAATAFKAAKQSRDELRAALALPDSGSEQSVSDRLAVDIQELRDVIPHAAQVGAVQTTISIELLAVLLAAYDKSSS